MKILIDLENETQDKVKEYKRIHGYRSQSFVIEKLLKEFFNSKQLMEVQPTG